MQKKYIKSVNQSNGSIIACKIKIADNFITRMIGLLNRNFLTEDEGLLITPSNSIHSFGMKFDFDALFLDENNKVVYIIEKMKPFRISPIVRKAKKVLELAEGTVSSNKIKLGDVIDFAD